MGLPRILRGVGLRRSDFWSNPVALPLAGISMPLLETAFLSDANVWRLPTHKSFLDACEDSTYTTMPITRG